MGIYRTTPRIMNWMSGRARIRKRSILKRQNFTAGPIDAFLFPGTDISSRLSRDGAGNRSEIYALKLMVRHYKVLAIVAVCIVAMDSINARVTLA